jgi:pyrroloquinoline quinone (PQQ) biosynthesis protein C
MMSFYEKLIEQTEVERRNLLSIPLLQSAVKGEIDKDIYHSFLIQAYHHVKHTTPLLMACGSLLPERLEWLREAVGEYIEEEMGHQEWILNDITALGENSENVRHGKPSLETELMISYAWDTIQRRNPIGFFGMVLVLEGTSVQLATQAAQAIQQSLELPDEAFSYLTSHGSLDIEHVTFFEKLMNKIDNIEDQEAIIHCAKVIYKLYGDIFRGL